VGFASLQHMQGEKVHVTRALPTRYVPPPGFDYPLDGFLPFRPDRFCFAPAALLGFTLRSFLLAKGNRTVSGPDGPTYRWPKPENTRRWLQVRSVGFWALIPSRVPGKTRRC